MKQRQLGHDGPMVGEIALGCMSFGGFYGDCSIETAHETLRYAFENGVTHLDTAKIYGDGLSEEIIGRFLKNNPLDFSIATKGGIRTSPTREFDNSEDYLTQCLEGSLKRLGVDYIDLYYVHRRDQNIPIEDVVGTLVKFKEQGKIGSFGFSEISPSSLKRAHAEHPVAVVQSEYSLWTRQPELGMIQACEELGTTFVPFSPLARGMLSDVGVKPSKFTDIDFRKPNPRFIEPNFSANEIYMNKFRQYAQDKGVPTASLALAWMLEQGDHLIPIPGTRTKEHLFECAQASELNLSESELTEIEQILPLGFAHGFRYSDQQQIGVEHYC